MKPLLVDLNNFEFVSFEMEGLNNLFVELLVAQDTFLEVLKNESDIASANSWYEVRGRDVFRLSSLSVNILPRRKKFSLLH